MASFIEAGGKTEIQEQSLDTFLNAIAGIPTSLTFKEQILDSQLIENELVATVHTSYQFYINDRLSHGGTNVFTFVKREGTWLIISLVDTRIRGGR